MPAVLSAEYADELAVITQKMTDMMQNEEDDSDDYAALEAKAEKLQKRIERAKANESRQAASAVPVHNPNAAAAAANITRIEDGWRSDPMCGFKKPDEFLLEVIDAAKPGAQISPQLRFLAAAGSDEAGTYSDPHGGFFVPEGMSPEVLSRGIEGDPTNPRQVPMDSPTVTFNARVDSSHASSVSGGLTVSRRAETQAPSATRTEYEQVKLEATGLYGLAYATEQLLERSPRSFAAIIAAGFADEFPSQMLKDKLQGTGAGEPLGVQNSAAKIEVAKESMQAADTINGTNLVKMRKRAYRYSQCIWLANHDTLDQLVTCHVSGTNADRFLFRFGEGGDLGDTLMGRPIFFTEYAKTLGDAGDIMLVNWTQYLWGTLGSTQPRRAESVHVRFLNHERTFKFWLENDGKPWWLAALTPVNGSNTLSPIVTLAERA